MADPAPVPPSSLRDRLLQLRPYRDELCALMRQYRFSSVEYRRLTDATYALDRAMEQLAGDKGLLQS